MRGGGPKPTRRLTELLAPRRPGGPGPAGEEWGPLLEAASRHRLLPALAAAGAEAGWLRPVPAPLSQSLHRHLPRGTALPEQVLTEALERNRARIEGLLDQATTVVAGLDDAGVVAAPMKGLDALWAGRYRDPAARTMTDLDLLVPARQANTARDVLVRLGYREVGPPAEHHLPAMALPGAEGSVELHTAVLRGRWAGLLPGEELIARSEPAPDRRGRRLHRDDAAAVVVAHAQLQDEGRLLLAPPMRALHETALLLAGPGSGPGVDWEALEERFGAAGRTALGALREHLHLTEVLFGEPSPLPADAPARRHGAIVVALADRPRTRAAAAQLAFLPRSFSAERMVALHGGPDRGPGLWLTRLRHAGAGAVRRAGIPASARRRWRPGSRIRRR